MRGATDETWGACPSIGPCHCLLVCMDSTPLFLTQALWECSRSEDVVYMLLGAGSMLAVVCEPTIAMLVVGPGATPPLP